MGGWKGAELHFQQRPITVPKAIRERLGLWAEAEAGFELRDGGVLLRKQQTGDHAGDRWSGFIQRPPGVTVDTALAEMRGKRAGATTKARRRGASA